MLLQQPCTKHRPRDSTGPDADELSKMEKWFDKVFTSLSAWCSTDLPGDRSCATSSITACAAFAAVDSTVLPVPLVSSPQDCIVECALPAFSISGVPQ